MRTQTLLIAAALAMTTTLAACESEVDNKPAAKVVEADDTKGADTKADDKKADDKADDKAADNGAATAGAAGTFAVAPDKSSIDWVGAKVTGDHKGGFKTFTGELTVADGKVTALTFDVDTTSIWSDTDMLTGHLKGPDFFDVEKFPKAAFKATKVEAKAEGEGDHTHVITGEMDLHGVKKTIAFPATVKVEADKVTANTEFTLKRFDFGIDYKGKANDLIKEDVLLKIKFEAPKKG